MQEKLARNKYDDAVKVVTVFNSCKTNKQKLTALRFLTLYLKYWNEGIFINSPFYYYYKYNKLTVEDIINLS